MTALNHTALRAGAGRPLVVALHCSGGSGLQWRSLRERLGSAFRVHAPDLMGTSATARWRAGPCFSLADEAAAHLALIDAAQERVHLVGHSYGGAVALHIAAARPHRIATLTLYEPPALHLLEEAGPAGAEALAEFDRLIFNMRCCAEDVADTAARLFVDFWNGAGSWSSMDTEARRGMIAHLPKLFLEYDALRNERGGTADHTRSRFPILVLKGGKSPPIGRIIADHLVRELPTALGRTVPEAGHMGPMSHRESVAQIIALQIEMVAVM